jgi:Tfp pilus assembly protein PilF
VRPLPLSESLPAQGTRVFAVDMSAGFEAVMEEGNVTGVSRTVAGNGDQADGQPVRILTSIPISPAQSGGPLVDRFGKVVGVTQCSDKYAQDPNVAISAEHLREPLGRDLGVPKPWLFPSESTSGGALDHAAAYFDRAQSKMGNGDVDGAIADYTEAIRLEPRAAEVYHHRGGAWMSKGDNDRAIADVTEALRLAPKSVETLHLRGALWFNQGDFDKTIADLDRAIDLDPTNATSFEIRGDAWLGKGDLDRAIADFSEAIRLDPEHHLPYLHRGFAWRKKGNSERANADFQVVNRRPGAHPLGESKHIVVVIESADAADEASAAKGADVVTPSGERLDGSKWILKGQWIDGAAEQQVVVRLDRNPDRDAQVCQVTFAGSGVGTTTFMYDVVLDRNKNRILLLPYGALVKENRRPAVATAMLMADNKLRFQGNIEGLAYTLVIDSEFSRLPDAGGD